MSTRPRAIRPFLGPAGGRGATPDRVPGTLKHGRAIATSAPAVAAANPGRPRMYGRPPPPSESTRPWTTRLRPLADGEALRELVASVASTVSGGRVEGHVLPRDRRCCGRPPFSSPLAQAYGRQQFAPAR